MVRSDMKTSLVKVNFRIYTIYRKAKYILSDLIMYYMYTWKPFKLRCVNPAYSYTWHTDNRCRPLMEYFRTARDIRIQFRVFYWVYDMSIISRAASNPIRASKALFRFVSLHFTYPGRIESWDEMVCSGGIEPGPPVHMNEHASKQSTT